MCQTMDGKSVVTRQEEEAETKRIYYHNTFQNYKNNVKQAWRVINDTLGKRNQKTNLLYLLNITIL